MSEARAKPTTMPPSRRFLLTGSLSALAATAAVAAIPAVAIGSTVEPDPAVVLGQQWRRAWKRLRRAWRAVDRAETAIRDRGEKVPLYPSITLAVGAKGLQWCGDVGTIMATCQREGGPGLEVGEALAADFRRQVRAYYRRRRSLGLHVFDREAADASREDRTVTRALAKTPATTVGGIAAKIYVIRDDFRDGNSDFSDAILRSALRDAERLSGKAVRSVAA